MQPHLTPADWAQLPGDAWNFLKILLLGEGTLLAIVLPGALAGILGPWFEQLGHKK